MPYAAAAAAVGGAAIQSDSASSAANKQGTASKQAIDITDREAQRSRADLAPYKAAGTAALSRLSQLLGIPGSENNAAMDWARSVYLPQIRQHMAEIGRPLADEWQPNDVQLQQWAQLAPDSVKAQATSLDNGSLTRKFAASDLAADPVYGSGLQFGLDEGTKALERHAAATGSYDSGADAKAITRFANDYGSTKAADSRNRFVEDQNNTFGKLSGITGMGTGATNVGIGAGSSSASNLASLYSGQGNAAAAAGIAGGNAISGNANNLVNYYSQQKLLEQLSGGGARTTKPDTTLEQ